MFANIVGSYVNVGASYVYEFVGKGSQMWTLVSTIIPFDSGAISPTNDLEFGTSSALTDDWLAVGAPFYNDFRGVVLIYETAASVFTYYQSIQNPIQTENAFGNAVALQGGSLFIGAPGMFVSLFCPCKRHCFVVIVYRWWKWSGLRVRTPLETVDPSWISQPE
jgi:hypothetical protein